MLGDQGKLCGKLEDIPSNDRIQYFVSYANASIHLERDPIFSVNYKLVDYCYNVTMTTHNSSIRLQPLHDLECYFKIHLPYGNRIELNVYQNVHKIRGSMTSNGHHEDDDDDNDNDNDDDETRAMPLNDSIESETVDLMSGQYIESVDYCTGIAIRIKETTINDRWAHCIETTDITKKFAFKSTGNALLIYVTRLFYDDFTRGTYNANDNQDDNVDASVLIEYRAVPIPEIVSQCAFGWIAVNQFCIAPVEQPLPWKEAESHCRSIGGHLASIKSDREQMLIDSLLINR